MVCYLFGVKPLSKPVVDQYYVRPWKQNAVKCESKYNKSAKALVSEALLSARAYAQVVR